MTTETTWRLDGRTAIITGAAGLIGSALSAGFAANGAHVVMVDRDGDGLARLAADLGGSVTCVECDVTDLGAIDEMARDVVRRFGAIDVLVNNAGGNRRILPHEVTLADWRHVTDLNLMSCFFVSQRIGQQMIAQRRGSIVNISSTCGCSGVRSPSRLCAHRPSPSFGESVRRSPMARSTSTAATEESTPPERAQMARPSPTCSRMADTVD